MGVVPWNNENHLGIIGEKYFLPSTTTPKENKTST